MTFLPPAALAVCALAVAAAAQDPEATPVGRARYLGRDIAQTMHWTGAGWLLRATREEEENGVALHRWLAVKPGQNAADLGCGNGYHTLPLARAVGAGGLVYGVELQPQYLVMLQKRAETSGLPNIVGVESTVDDAMLPAASCDLVLMVDVYHELSHPVRVMQSVRDALRPGGRVVLVEFRAEDPAVPIKPEHTMTKAQMLRELASHGFAAVAETDELPWQHAIAFAPAAADPRLGARATLAGFLRAEAAGDARVVAPFVAEDARIAPPATAPAATTPPLELAATPTGLRAQAGARAFALVADDDGRWFAAPPAATAPVRPHGGARPFFAMHTGTGGGAIGAQADLVRELGFDGLAWDLADLPAARVACEERGMDVGSAYAVLRLPTLAADAKPADVDAALAGVLAPLRAALQALAGGPGQLWLALDRADGAANGAAGDALALAALRALLPDARATGVEIALYPHHGCWLATAADAMRVLAAAPDRHLGVCFNPCHELRATDATDLRPLLRACGERLLAVTVHGADVAGADWSTLIRPLGDGDLPLAGLLAELDALGFAGPVGLQGFGVSGPARDHLARSVAAWRAAHAARTR